MKKILLLLILVTLLVNCRKHPNHVVEAGNSLFENFDKDSLHPKIVNYNKSNITERGEYAQEEIDGQLGLASILKPTISYEAPHRAEFTIDLEEYYNENDEIWIGYDLLVPSSYDLDSINSKRGVVIFQIHSKPTSGSSWSDYKKNLPFNRPSIALHLRKNNDKYFVFLMYGLNGKPNTAFEDRKWSKVFEREVAPDMWHHVVFNFRLSHDDQEGYVAMFLDDEKYKSKSFEDYKIYGANMHNDAKPYLKMGFYRYWNDSHTHKVYHDNLSITGSRENYVNLSEQSQKTLPKE